MLDSTPPPESDSHTSPSPTFEAHGGLELRGPQKTGNIGGAEVPPAPRPTRAFGTHQLRVYLFIFALVVSEIPRGITTGSKSAVPSLPRKSSSPNDDLLTRALPGPALVSFLRFLAPGMVQMYGPSHR